jgi:hypothetical protein
MKRPLLQVTLFNGTQRKQVICLVDSGADECLFHASIGRRLGIDIESGRYKRFDGIAGSLEAYIHVIEIQIQDLPERVPIEAGFTESDGVDAILGQAGFLKISEFVLIVIAGGLKSAAVRNLRCVGRNKAPVERSYLH